MKILICGDWHSDLHEEVVFNAFLDLGHEVFGFKWHSYFLKSTNYLKNFFHKLQNKIIFGPIICKINKDFLDYVTCKNPDVIFIYRGTHISPGTLKKIKLLFPKVIIIGYNNDDPFSPNSSIFLWHLFKKNILICDIVFAYRDKNIDDYKKLGLENVYLLRSWFSDSRNFPINNKFYKHDVVFIGHYENDGRIKLLEKIVSNGISLKIFGPGWNRHVIKSRFLKDQMPVSVVWGEEYNRTLCQSKIALCFLSKLNRDTYTRRNFEIPASGSFMLSEYSTDLCGLFKEGRDAEFFRNEDELISKIKFYLHNDIKREGIAESGRRRVMEDGHNAISRMKYVLNVISEYQEGKLIQ